MNDAKKRWTKQVSEKLVGRTIKAVRYMTKAEQKNLGWYRSAVVLTLDDDTILYPSADDEGNDAGALFTNIEDLPTIPVI